MPKKGVHTEKTCAHDSAASVSFSATIAELRATGTASDADLEKRLSEYAMTKYMYGISSSSSLQL